MRGRKEGGVRETDAHKGHTAHCRSKREKEEGPSAAREPRPHTPCAKPRGRHAPLLVLVPLVAAAKGHVDVGLAALVERDQEAGAVVAKANGEARSAHLLVRGRGWGRRGEVGAEVGEEGPRVEVWVSGAGRLTLLHRAGLKRPAAPCDH